MSKIPNIILLGMAEIEAQLTDVTLEENVLLAMRASQKSFWCRKDDEKFRAAVGALMTHYGDGSTEFERLAWEMRKINQMGVMLHGVELGLTFAGFTDDDNEYKALGLLGIYHQEKENAHGN